MLGLSDTLEAFPSDPVGRTRQRVALGRGCRSRAKILLWTNPSLILILTFRAISGVKCPYSRYLEATIIYVTPIKPKRPD